MKQTILILSFFFTILSQSLIIAAEVNKEDTLTHAIKLFQEADYNRAIDELKKISRETRENKTALEAAYLIGMAYRALGNWSETAEWFQISSKYEPLADYSAYYSGEAYLISGNYQSAFNTFSSLKSGFSDSRWREEAGFKAAMALFKLGRYIESRSSLEQFIKENPRSSLLPQVWIKIAECDEGTGETKEAYNHYKEVWVNYPTSPESRTASDGMKRISSNEVATTSSDRHFSKVSMAERYNRVCNLFYNNNHRDGINELTAIVDELERNDEGRPKWFAESLLKLGDAYYQTRDDNKAVEVLKRIPTDSSPPRLLEESVFIKAKALQRSGHRAEAAAAFEKLITDYPTGGFTAKSIFRLADMADYDGDAAKARGLYHKLYVKLPQSSMADDALWKEGWLTYLGKDFKKAYLIFQKLLSSYPDSEFADTATYWSARTAEKMGMVDKAKAHYADVVSRFPLSYYATISRGRLSVISSDAPVRNVKTVSYTPRDGHAMPERYTSLHLEKSKALIDLGFTGDASEELSLAEARCANKETLLEIARLMTKIGDYNKAHKVVMKGFQEFLKDAPDSLDEIWTIAFPEGFGDVIRSNADKNSLNPFLIHAIIKEESAYKPDAVSRAGAIGLMQLMPSTGSRMSKETGFKDYSSSSLYRSEVNISLGSRYMKKLIGDSKGKIPIAIASYNAGPNAVSEWASRYGTEQMDEFIERIPYSETRNYVKKVLRSYDVYERLYGQSRLNDSRKPAL